jgi:sterol desaturase/sphingolipid hydroxylase (fatty acid hydroxylase superfamily)
MEGWGDLARLAGAAALRVGHASAATFYSLGSTFSLASLASALVLAAVVIAASRWRRRGRVRWKVLIRALAPRRAVLGASGKADVGFFLFNTFSAGGLIGWALISQSAIAGWTSQVLAHQFGASPLQLAGFWPAAATSAAMFLAYEIAYWLDHWLSHNVPALWELHKVHHTAEALSPLTNFRVHPLETVKFYNIAAACTGAAAGLLDYGIGATHGRLALFGTDALFVVFMCSFAHLQHSHFWISFKGPVARLLMSPAAHQIHHSTDPRHFNRNLGNALAIWDWLFGTLYLPAARREPLVFGVAGETVAAHTVTGALITPMVRSAQVLLASLRPASPASSAIEGESASQ